MIGWTSWAAQQAPDIVKRPLVYGSCKGMGPGDIFSRIYLVERKAQEALDSLEVRLAKTRDIMRSEAIQKDSLSCAVA